jgi:hypothetical protein
LESLRLESGSLPFSHTPRWSGCTLTLKSHCLGHWQHCSIEKCIWCQEPSRSCLDSFCVCRRIRISKVSIWWWFQLWFWALYHPPLALSSTQHFICLVLVSGTGSLACSPWLSLNEIKSFWKWPMKDGVFS